MVSNEVVEQREDWRKLIIFHFSLFPKYQHSLFYCCTFFSKTQLMSGKKNKVYFMCCEIGRHGNFVNSCLSQDDWKDDCRIHGVTGILLRYWRCFSASL